MTFRYNMKMRLRRICSIKKIIIMILTVNFLFLSFTLHSRRNFPYEDDVDEYDQEMPQDLNQTQLTVVLQRRLGHMMFQVASGYAIAKRNKMQFALPCDQIAVQELKELFPVLNEIPCTSNASTFTELKLNSWHKFDAAAFDVPMNRNVALNGHLESYTYFKTNKYSVKRLFEFSPQIQASSAESLKNATRGRRRAKIMIGVHVHRCEYHQPLAKHLIYVLPDADYYETAMDYFRRKFDDILFVVVSEDLQWSRDNIHGDDIVFVNSTSLSSDMCTLSMMNHVIISIGTSGWWSAFLNEGNVIYFRHFLAKKISFDADDYFPKQWGSLRGF